MDAVSVLEYHLVVDEICHLRWSSLDRESLTNIAWAYHHFSIQFRENLEIACRLYPEDAKLRQLKQEECDTDNLSPWPGVAAPGERMNHDEFMRRTLRFSPLDAARQRKLEEIGRSYLQRIRRHPPTTRALSISSYEDGGLERVFRAFLTAPSWSGPLLQAFRHFLVEHIRFDSDVDQGHGALSRHLAPDDRVRPLWMEFKQLLVLSAPELERLGRHVFQAARS